MRYGETCGANDDLPPHQCSVLLADIAMMSAAVDGIEVAEAVALSMV